jgi:hypothetical protein
MSAEKPCGDDADEVVLLLSRRDRSTVDNENEPALPDETRTSGAGQCVPLTLPS